MTKRKGNHVHCYYFTPVFEWSIKQLSKLAFCDKIKKYDTVFLFDMTSLSGKCMKEQESEQNDSYSRRDWARRTVWPMMSADHHVS